MNHFAVPMKLKHCKSTIAQYKIKQTNKQKKKHPTWTYSLDCKPDPYTEYLEAFKSAKC